MSALIEKAARAAFDSQYKGEHPDYWWENERERMMEMATAIVHVLEADGAGLRDAMWAMIEHFERVDADQRSRAVIARAVDAMFPEKPLKQLSLKEAAALHVEGLKRQKVLEPRGLAAIKMVDDWTEKA